jgi:hypothetical protein
MAALPVCLGAEVWRWMLIDPKSYVIEEACEGRLVILSSSRAIAVGRRRLCHVGGVMTRMLLANGYKMRLLSGSRSSLFFFLSSHSIKKLH